MTIQRRARITTAVLILFVVGTVAVLFWNSSQVGEGIKTIDTTSRAVDSAFMMRVLMFDYLADRNARTLKEWEMHRETLGRILNEMSSGSIDEALLEDLKGNYQSVSALADKAVRMLSVRDAADRLQASGAKDMIDKLMLLKLEQLVDAAHDLSKATQSLTLGRRYFVQQIIIAIGVLGLAFIVINVYLMRKSVVQPLKRLSEEAEKIGAGDFAHFPEINSDDEVGNLSRAFKEMVARLQQRDIALRQARDEIALRLEERSAALQRTTAYNNMLQAIQRVQTQFIANTDSEELFGTLLEDLLALSESEFGFVGELLYTETGQPYLKDRAITDIAWDEESRKVYERFAGDHGLEFHDIHGLWGAVILSGEPVISPDPRIDPRSSGLPQGHPPLNAFLGIPFRSDGNVIGMAGLANRPGGYDRDMLDFLQPYASTCTSIIEAYRNENRRRETEQRLFETNQRLQALMDALPVGISFTDDLSCDHITGNPCLFDQFEMTPDANISASARDTAASGRLVRYRHMGRDITDTELPLQRAVKENRVIPPMELEVQLPSGRRWFAEASGAPIVDGQGAVVGGVAVTVDITERKQAEEAIRKAHDELEFRVQERTAELEKAKEAIAAERQRLYDILETMPVMVCLLTPDYHVAFANRSFCEKYGEDKGRHCFDYRFGQNEPCESCETYNVLKTGKPHHWECTVPDGSVVDVYDFPFADSDGSPLILEMEVDITERKEAEKLREKVIEQSEILEKMFSTTYVSIVFLDRNFNFVRVNQAYADSCGCPPEFFPGKNHFDLYPHPENEAIFKRVVESGEPFTVYAKPFEFPDDPERGTTYWDWTLHPVKDSLERVEGLVFVLVEVTEREKANEVVRESERRFQLVTETIQDVFWMSTPGVGRMVYISPAYEKVWGRSIESLYGSPRSFMDAVHPDDLDHLVSVLQEYHAQGREYSCEYRIVGPGGAIRWIHERGFPVLHDGSEVALMCGVCTDVTERKRAEGERERLIGELEGKNAELERFTYSVSHDLKSPLITIRSFVGFIQEDLPSGNIQDVERDLERISKAAEKMGQLLDEILELSRIGRMVNPPTEIAMEDLAHEVLELLAGRIADRSAKVDIAAGLPVVHGDRPRLLEVLQNLIENALKFMGDQPHPAIEVGARQECAEVIFYVQDNGVGIDPSYQERVFGLFDKLDQNSEGTGIGLALVKRIVEVHGGRIWVESAGFGKGSTFYFTIPRAIQTCETPTEKLP